MQELLLVNPARRTRRKSRKAASPAQRRARAAFAARARAKNPARRRRASRAVAVRRRRNPVSMTRRITRRRNPIGSGVVNTAMGMVKDAAIGGAGALAVDVIAGQVKPMLPTSMQTGNAYAAAKALITVGVGVLGRRLVGNVAMQAARGSLTVQAYNLMKPYVPATMQLGALSPTYIMPGARSGKPNVVASGGGVAALRRVTNLSALSPGQNSLRAVQPEYRAR